MCGGDARQETESQYGLIVFAPVYQTAPCNGSAAADGGGGVCRRLAGLTDAVFRISDLVVKSQAGLAQVRREREREE